MKRNWSVFIGLSVVAGLASSLLLGSQAKKAKIDSENIKKYQGTWWFIDQNKNVQHRLEIFENLSIAIDNKPIATQIIELTSKRLTLQDALGYHIRIQCENQIPATIYDEADDKEYALIF